MGETITREVALFLQRPGIKPAHRIYALAFLNKVGSKVAPQDNKIRVVLLRIYFGLFKKLIHADPEEEKNKKADIKKDRTISKKDRIKAIKKAKAQQK